MNYLEPELPEEKQIFRELKKRHGDMLPGSLAALEAISVLFKGSAPVNVYWFLADEWERKNPYAECVHEVTLNYNESAEKTFHIPTDFRHELKPRKVRRLSAFVMEQRKRLRVQSRLTLNYSGVSSLLASNGTILARLGHFDSGFTR